MQNVGILSEQVDKFRALEPKLPPALVLESCFPKPPIQVAISSS